MTTKKHKRVVRQRGMRVMLSNAEYERVQAGAWAEGLSISAYVRRLLTRAIEEFGNGQR